jgi:DNA helicase-2/ATP-dependent DNA helicase PcrA
MDELFDDLNPEQRFAVETLDGPLCVVAGAGSGKTRVVTRRVAHLIARGSSPDSVLGVTFTNKAAREMRDRVLRLTGAYCRTLCTFHGFCAEVLRTDFPALGRSADFTIYDDGDQRALMRSVVDELALPTDQFDASDLLDHLSAARNARPGEAPPWKGRRSAVVDDGVARACALYLERLATSNAVDFDDLLVQTVRLFEERPEALARWRARFSHVIVDEFQDVNDPQYRLAKLLTAESRNLCVTGDPDQSIYSWRGADPAIFDAFRRDYPDAAEVVLAQNYRSTNAILRAASEAMRPAPGRTPKTLWSELGDGEPVRVVRFPTDRDEADAIAAAVGEFESDGIPRGGQAILYRTNALSLPLERALASRGVPYRTLGGPGFFERAEVRDVLAYLRALANPRDEQAFARALNVPPRGIGAKTERALFDEARRRGVSPFDLVVARGWPADLRKPAREALERFAVVAAALRELPLDRPAAVLAAVLEATEYAAWWAARPAKGRGLDPLRNLEALASVARDYEAEIGGDLGQFLEHASLQGGRARDEEFGDPVTLATIHAAKGLEFDSVVLVGVEVDLLPHVNARRDPAAYEEERRLFHVALTRAKRRLNLTHCDRRTTFGKERRSARSPFIDDLIDAGVEFQNPSDGGGAGSDAYAAGRDFEREEDPDDPLLNLHKGALVRHPTYGEGEVVRVSSRTLGLDATAVVRFGDGTERALVLRYSKLTALEVDF